MALLMGMSMLIKSDTTDEYSHLSYGFKILNADPTRVGMFDDSKMPFSVLNAISVIAADKLTASDSSGDRSIAYQKMRKHALLLWGRGVTILCALVLGIFVFQWSKALYGPVPALFSLMLYAFSPNMIAHSRLITSDLYATLMTTVSLYYFWRFTKTGEWKVGALSAFVLGLGQLAKYTCVFLYPLFFMIVIVRFSKAMARAVTAANKAVIYRYIKSLSVYSALFIITGILIINVGFLFQKTFTPLKEYAFESDLFNGIQSISILQEIPVPVPYPYLRGLDMVSAHEKKGSSFGNIYLLGELRRTDNPAYEGFNLYFVYAFLFKEPLAAQLFILLAILVLIRCRQNYECLQNELFLIAPVVFFVIYFSFFFKAQIGIRFILIIFPLLYIFCGKLLVNYRTFTIKTKSVLTFLSFYLIVSVVSYFPHYLSYFNELLVDRKQAYKILADSNIDWGQNKFYLIEYTTKNPGLHIIPKAPVVGRVVVNVNRLVGVDGPAGQYRWLREHCEPVDHIGYSYLVYDTSANSTTCRGAQF